ncbi:LysM peptidoglycan-binding domain-containing protein [Neobacillus niacini]|uniref:C40 family peptidase n=1 Tax=Neobacillus niacini TaxID=86668 RepID=UPI0021CB3BA2|nr:peptidoglycan endopeptidase [Neobacillus niacini]MCM3763947.1 LysM peptidoglycan-binding domain-containing protein [Neobacillus niacini]
MDNKTIVRVLSTTAFLSLAYAGAAHASTYTVQKGDTLSKIALTHKTTVSQLKSLNGLTSDLIYPNQTLKVSAEPAAAPKPQQPAAQTPQPAAAYTVVKGDALIKIANRYGVTVAELKQWNNISGTIIYIGQTLKVSAPGQAAPAPAPSPAPAPTPAPAPAPTPAPAPNPSTAPPSWQSSIEYTIVSGDSLSKIASKFGTTVGELRTLNNLSSDLIYAGRKLLVPGPSGSAAPAPAPGVAPAPATDFGSKTIEVAKSLMGIPYVWGGSTLSGFDCSGFIYYVANQSGKKIGRYSAAGYYDRSYYVDQPQIGDLVFFANTYQKGISHVGFYIGNNQFIHANSTNGVMISSLSSTYYKQHFEAFKRLY